MITIQAGNYSNFVGAHLFNLQNPETQEDKTSTSTVSTSSATTLWREINKSRSPQSGPSFAPRLLIFDTKDNVAFTENAETKLLKSSSSAAAYAHKQNAALWDGKVDNLMDEEEDEEDLPAIIQKPVINSSTSLPPSNKDYSRWGDFISWKLNPENFHLLPNFSHNAETGQVDSYSQGLEIWKMLEDKAEDGIRKYSEECDRLEGFNLLVDQLNGYSGLAGGLIQYLSDEYEKKVCIGLGLCPPVVPIVQNEGGDEGGSGGAGLRAFRTRMTNTTLLWNAFNSYSSVFTSLGLCQNFCVKDLVPATLPYLQFKATSYYESSAILATAIDTLLSPSIAAIPSPNSLSLQELASLLNAMGRNMTSVSSSFPFPLDIKSSSLFGTLNSNGLDSLRMITPGIIGPPDFSTSNGNYFAVRGIPDSAIISENERKGVMGQHRHIKNAQSCLELYAQESFPRAVNVITSNDSPLTITSPYFPCQIVEEFAKDSFKLGQRYSKGSISSWSLSSCSSAQNSTKCGELIDKVLKLSTGQRNNANKVTQTLPSVNELGMDVDDFMESVNNLQTLKSAYDINHDS